MLNKLKADARCANIYKNLKVDFAKQTMVSYRAGGDCFLHVTAKVFRNVEAKKYTVRIRNVWGGCRAGGSFQGWLVVEKIPDNYTLDFVETKVKKYDLEDTEDTLNLNSQSAHKINSTSQTEALETRPYAMKGCIQTYRQKQFVIKDEAAYLKAIRNDASRGICFKILEKIDFGKHTLIGIEINSGYCGMPPGLAYQTLKDEAKKQYLLSVSYTDPKHRICRALMPYDLWVLVPKLPDGYQFGFELTAKP